MKKIGVIQSNYIPWKGYFDFISRVDEFYLYDCVQYTPRNWRNRNCIKTRNGLKWLTIPVIHNARKEKICDKKVADPSWKNKHWTTLGHTYAHAPYFKQYEGVIKNMYLGCQEYDLSLINMEFLNTIKNIFCISTPLILANDHKITGDKNGDLIALCLHAGADVYLAGPSTKIYVDEARFNAAGIKVEWMSYDYPEYNQLYPPFEHKVTVLDLLFNEGPRSADFFRSYPS